MEVQVDLNGLLIVRIRNTCDLPWIILKTSHFVWSTGLPGKIVDFWEVGKVRFELREIVLIFFFSPSPDVNKVCKMVDVTFGAVSCKAAPSTSLSQSMLGCRVVVLGLPEFSAFILIFFATVLRTGTYAQIYTTYIYIYI